ncbi:MAG TPA: 2-amino-4-hydroxy-6-hydroxymethyldihydropteridine diphosphokinase, partial [Flavobacterium sp.]|nr:2-amino-4-hydroxy-6-hydroxymethyldihydropteridine diphosphokinase [Flavobacterium sp.]
MNSQNLVVLAIGSNQGNRLENITNCIDLIHRQIGTVVIVSKVYETPAWGFNGAAFYNCALVMHTDLAANDILELVLKTEESLGRIRSGSEGYQSRLIDIDVITFNEEIIETAHLNVPHPLMHERLFVLLPMRDLNLDWRHPVFQKYLHELLAVSQDKSVCQVVSKLEAPLRNINLEKYNYIAI